MTNFELISPLPLPRCAKRLSYLHEERTWLAWGWQTRRIVKLTPTQDGYHFVIKRVRRSSRWELGNLRLIEGQLTAQTSQQTLITGQQKLNWFTISLLLISFLPMLVVMLFMVFLSFTNPCMLIFPLFLSGAIIINGLYLWQVNVTTLKKDLQQVQIVLQAY